VKELDINGDRINSAIAIQHKPTKGAPPLNTLPLSQTIEDAYSYNNSSRFDKSIIRFVPKRTLKGPALTWYVIDATETGELIGLADVPHRLGIDPRSYVEPSSSSATGDAYCTKVLPIPLPCKPARSLKPIRCPRSILSTNPTTAMSSSDWQTLGWCTPIGAFGVLRKVKPKSLVVSRTPLPLQVIFPCKTGRGVTTTVQALTR
jgi:hypothetical protein